MGLSWAEMELAARKAVLAGASAGFPLRAGNLKAGRDGRGDLLLDEHSIESAQIDLCSSEAQWGAFTQILIFLCDDQNCVLLPLLCEFVDSRSYISSSRVSQIGVETVGPPENDEMVELANCQRDDHRNL